MSQVCSYRESGGGVRRGNAGRSVGFVRASLWTLRAPPQARPADQAPCPPANLIQDDLPFSRRQSGDCRRVATVWQVPCFRRSIACSWSQVLSLTRPFWMFLLECNLEIHRQSVMIREKSRMADSQ